MAKFVLVNEQPESLRDGEHFISMPLFLEEIRVASARQMGRKNLTSSSYLRSIANMISINYDQEFDPLRHLKAHDYEGLEFKDELELSAIVRRMLRENYPKIFDKFVEAQLKKRPHGTKVIFFGGTLQESSAFFENGIDLIDKKDVDVELGLKAKKIVGKPAVSKAEADDSSE